MNSLNMYDNIEVGDTIYFPNLPLAVKSGKVIGFRKWNGHAKRVLCEGGVSFEISKHSRTYVLSVDEDNN